MTRAPWHGEAGQGEQRLREILSRLLVLLVFTLFGVPQGHAEATLAPGGPVAESQGEQAQGILTAQRHQLRPKLSDESSADMAMAGAADLTRQLLFATAVSPVPLLSLLPFALRIQPPVRGQPVV